MIWLIPGLLIGMSLGVLLMGLLIAAARGKDDLWLTGYGQGYVDGQLDKLTEEVGK